MNFIDVHLTNVAVQKTAPDYDPEKGSKWSVRQMRQYLCAKHGKEAVSMRQMLQNICINARLMTISYVCSWFFIDYTVSKENRRR